MRISKGWVAAAVLAFATTASADTIMPGGSWNGTWVADNDGSEYWDNLSDDGTNCNIGFFIAGTLGPFGPCANQSTNAASPNAILEFLDDGSGGDPGDQYFKNTAPQSAVMIIEVAGLRDTNEFGIYKQGDALSRVTLFVGADSPFASVSFTPAWMDYGFFFRGGDGDLFYTESSLNTVDVGVQHFAFFRERAGSGYDYILGGADRNAGENPDYDYQDMVVRVTAVPEPGSMILLGSGLLGLAGAARRRMRKQ